MKNAKAQIKEHKRAVVQQWIDKAYSAILNKNCPVILAAINSMTTAQLNALLKVVVGCYRAGYQEERNDQQNKKGA